jgi:hypothetical protein
MWLIDQLVEARVAQAAARGEFDDLPGAGRPLALDDDPLVPAELRTAYRLLKNAGYVPEELRLRGEIREAEDLLRAADDEAARARHAGRLRLLLERLNRSGRGTSLVAESGYFEALCDRLEGRP